MKVPCSTCGTPIDFNDAPAPTILNDPGMSCVVAPHPQRTYCIGCKSQVALSLQTASLGWMARTVGVQQKSPIIIAPSGSVPRPQN